MNCNQQLLYYYQFMSVPNTFNPSDYEYLIKSLAQGSLIAKSQSLKRFLTLAVSDKKQFSIYAKRIVLALQQLISQQKEEINILTSMLVLEIINLNPKDIEYYLRTKLLKKIVINLGDSKPQLRKTSHYCILAYIKTYRSIDQMLNVYSQFGICSIEGQLRQKSINSFQSIVITDPGCLNWNSLQFKKIFQILLQRLKDESPYVQKAAEQCLLTLTRLEESITFAKKLSPSYSGIYKIFCETQREIGNLQSLYIQKKQKHSSSQKNLQNSTSLDSHRSQKNLISNNAHLQKINTISRQETINKQALIERIQEIRKNSQTPRITQKLPVQSPVKKIQRQKILSPIPIHKESTKSPEKMPQIPKAKQMASQSPKIHPIIFAIKSQKVQNVFGKKLLDDLKNDKDWKIRLEAVQQLQTKFQIYKQAFQIDTLVKSLVPPLIKLLSDQNFKIASITLKVFEDLLHISQIPLETIVPQIVEKLSDGKVALRQGVARLIRTEYLKCYNPIWLDNLLQFLKKTTSHSIREEILGIITRLYQDELPKYPIQKIIEAICPLMDDPKTKVKIRTLELLVLITIITQRVDIIKSIVSSRLNQVYYEMFLQKVGKQMKHRVTPRIVESQPPPHGQSRTLSFPSLRKNKNSANNTTSTSLQKYSKTIEAKPITRAVSLIDPKDNLSNSNQPPKIQPFPFDQQFSQREKQRDRSSFTPNESVRKKPIKAYKRKIQRTLESKLALTQSIDSDSLRPFSNPQNQCKSLLVDLKSQDWQTAYDGLTRLRRLLRHHLEVLSPQIARPIALETANLVESLRSSLSKNAVIALGECAKGLGRILDSQLEGIFARLMRKTLDANSFISEEVRKTLILVSTNCHEGKVVNTIKNYYLSRAIPVKTSIISVIQALLQNPRVIEKQTEKIMQYLISFMGEGALQIRDRSKSLILKLLSLDKSGKVYRNLPAQILQKIKRKQSSQIINQASNIKETVIVSPQKQQKQVPAQKIQLIQAKKKKKILIFPKQFDQFEQLLLACESSDWKIRQSTLLKMLQIIRNYPEEIGQYRLNTRIIQMFAKLSNDPNSKVAISSLSIFEEIVRLIPKVIQANLSVLINEIFNCFASQKQEVRQLSLNVFDQIANRTQHWMLIQHLCSGALYGSLKGRGNVLVKLIKILPNAFRDKKSVVEKNIYNLLNKLVEEPKGDVTPILKELIVIVLNIGGEQAYTALKQNTKSFASI